MNYAFLGRHRISPHRGRSRAEIGEKTRPLYVGVNSASSGTTISPSRSLAWEEIAVPFCPEFAHEYDENDAKYAWDAHEYAVFSTPWSTRGENREENPPTGRKREFPIQPDPDPAVPTRRLGGDSTTVLPRICSWIRRKWRKRTPRIVYGIIYRDYDVACRPLALCCVKLKVKCVCMFCAAG